MTGDGGTIGVGCDGPDSPGRAQSLCGAVRLDTVTTPSPHPARHRRLHININILCQNSPDLRSDNIAIDNTVT